MKKTLLLFFIIFQIVSISTVKSMEVDTSKIHKNDFNNYDKRLEDIRNKIDNNQKEYNGNITLAKQDMKDLLNTYVISIGLIIGLIGFSINFFGRKAIKVRVEEIIAETAQSHVDIAILTLINSKITTELISELIKDKSEKELDVLLKSIETKGETTINQFKLKGNEVLNSMIATPKKIERNIVLGEATDDEINKINIVNRGEEYFNLAYTSKDPKIQIELYKNVIEIQPQNIGAYNNIGVAYNEIDKFTEAIGFLNKGIAINPNFDVAYGNRAHSYNQLNDFDQALKDIEKAIELNPRNDFAYGVKGNVLTKLDKFIEAEEALDTAIQLSPNSPQALFNRGYYYEERKLYEKSEIDYNNAEKNGFPNKPLLYNNMAVLYRRQKRYTEAIDLIKKAREYNPDYPNLDGTLALIYADQNMDDEFYKYITSALQKGCRAWNYLSDPGFDKYRDSSKLTKLFETYKKMS